MSRLLSTFTLAAMLATAGTVNYSYDAAGRLVKVDCGAAGGSITYTYDNAGNLLSRTVVPAGQQVKEAKEPKKRLDDTRPRVVPKPRAE